MLIRAYLPKFLTALFGGLFIALGIFSFGNHVIFDRVFFAILIFTGVICRENRNILSLVVIMFIQATWDEFSWQIITNDYWFKLVFYPLSIYVVYYLKYDKIIRIVIPAIILAILAEIYWYLIQYPSPDIVWYVSIILSNLVARHLIFMRVSIIEHYFPGQGESINLDWLIYKINFLAIIIQAVMVVEYLLRHIVGFKDLLVVYHTYPYLVQILATLSIWAAFNESYRYLMPRILKT